MFDLSGKTALITGASGGIGGAIVVTRTVPKGDPGGRSQIIAMPPFTCRVWPVT